MNTLSIIVTFFFFVSASHSHLVGDRSHVTELKKLCDHAYTCFHDTVIICGKSVNEARTFIDLCDMYEYSCEYSMVFRHVKEDEGVCPNQKELGPGVVLLLYTSNVKGHSESIKNEEECKIADLCIHDKVPMCGIDSCGEMRTFIDTCDMHEFNCDSRKDFKQRPIHECWVTCKRGRSFKKPEYRTDCNLNVKSNRP